MKKIKKIVLVVLSIIAVFLLIYFYFVSKAPKKEIAKFGVTFSKSFAEKFGLDWKKTYESIFTDLKIKDVRIPVYWNEIEKNNGEWNFNDIDWQIKTAEKYDGKVILAVGRKLPRWPECHIPDWAKLPPPSMPEYENDQLIEYIKKVVERYKNEPAVYAWQVENEPFLKFGECPMADGDFLDKEIETVKKISDKPVIVSDSGEFGTWIRSAKRADIFGSTMYRYVHNKFFGYVTYPVPSSFFRFKQGIVKTFIDKNKPMIVVELQAEPWQELALYKTGIDEHFKHFDMERMLGIFSYIKGTGFDTYYLWGVEWWYWAKETQGHPEMWDFVKRQIQAL